MSNRPSIENNIVTIPKGYGYWDITNFPWGGNFKRAEEDIHGALNRILDTYNDGSPRKVSLTVNSNILGVQF